MQFVPAQSPRAASRHSDHASVRRVVHIAACSFLVLVTLSVRTSWAQHRLEAVVVDAETRAPLAGAHVMLAGTTTGSVANAEGRFTLIVQRLPAELRVRHIGYETQVLQIEDPASLEVIGLQPAVLELDELLVTGETFAEGLMRKVLEQNQLSIADLRTYEAQGFSRVLLERNETIVYVGEATFDQYWHRARGIRSVVTNFSQTANWYDELPLPHAAHVPNLYGDYVSIQGLEFIGPTHPDALERYTFRLAGRRMLDAHVICWMAARSRQALPPAGSRWPPGLAVKRTDPWSKALANHGRSANR